MTKLSSAKQKIKKKPWLEKLSHLLYPEPKTREELTDILRDAEERHLLDGEMLSMIERIFQVGEMTVDDIMVPRSEMVSCLIHDSLQTILDMAITSGHSRFPVFSDNHREVVGIVLAKDLLIFQDKNKAQNFSLKSVIRPVTFVTQTKMLNELLRDFRINRHHLAVVIDEYHDVTGLITIEDVLEQIVGDIADEYDVSMGKEEYIRAREDGDVIIKGNTPISEFCSYFELKWEDQTGTVSDWIIANNGQSELPKRGEIKIIQGLTVKILQSDHQQIGLCEIRKIKAKK